MITRYHHHEIVPPLIDCPDAHIPTELEEYLFDLQGFIIVRGALSRDEVDAGNAAVDAIPRSVPRDGWHGYIHREDHPEHRGISLQQIYEAGEPFVQMIDHPNYINLVTRFVGGHDTFDRHHGPLFIDECFFNIRGAGEAIPVHSGGDSGGRRTTFNYHNGRFSCGQVNALFAFTDIGPGDGATMVIPGSHKSNFLHPGIKALRGTGQWAEGGGGSVEGIPGAIEVHMNAGDAIVFSDAITHGSARRANPGERRICVYRYGSAWNRMRYGYEPSEALLERLNPFARSIVTLDKKRRPPM